MEYVLLCFAVKSRVLMSLRGEQDDLNWFDIYGPNVPYAELDKHDMATSDVTTSDAKDGPLKPDDRIELENETSADQLTMSETFDEVAVSTKVVTATVEKVEVVEVTVDGRFGHANHSRDEPLKSVGKGLTPDIKVEGLVKSADAI